MKVKRYGFGLFVILLALLMIYAGADLNAGVTGKIAGRVVDKDNGEALPGANMVIQGTTLGAATDVDGNYYIINVPPGIYSLRASSIGIKMSSEWPGESSDILIENNLFAEGEIGLSMAGNAEGAYRFVNAEVLEFVPVELAEKYRCLPLFVREEGGANTLFLAMEDPSDLEALDDLAFQIGQKLRPVLVAPTELEDALQRHYHAAALMGPADALPPVPVSEPERPDPQDAETAPDLLPLDPLLDPGAALDPNVAPVFEAPSVQEPSQGLEPRLILRALAQLLVEKGVLTRDELAERLRSIASQERRGS